MNTFSNLPLRINWHTAFVQALQIELYAYRDVLEFHPEDPLTTEPLRIDCVVIKKAKDTVIEKNIAAIFKEWNLVEYKNPRDYVSISDFYKVYGYACLYASLKKTPITSMSITFVGSSMPGKLLEHLRKERSYTIAESGPGIYTVEGDIIPIQIIDSRKLSAEENLWLKSLRSKLEASEVENLGEEMSRLDKSVEVGAYLEAVAQANYEKVEEIVKMAKAKNLMQVFENAGWLAEWESRGMAKGMAEGKLEIARKLKDMGDSAERIQTATGLSPEDIAKL